MTTVKFHLPSKEIIWKNICFVSMPLVFKNFIFQAVVRKTNDTLNYFFVSTPSPPGNIGVDAWKLCSFDIGFRKQHMGEGGEVVSIDFV